MYTTCIHRSGERYAVRDHAYYMYTTCTLHVLCITAYYLPRTTYHCLLPTYYLGTLYEIKHSTVGPHTLSWASSIVNPKGTVLLPGSVVLSLFPLWTPECEAGETLLQATRRTHELEQREDTYYLLLTTYCSLLTTY